jgi:pimeloyl-ACP methyl ester carboxylesterase
MRMLTRIAVAAALVLVAASCSDSAPNDEATNDATPTTTTAAAVDDTTTTTSTTTTTLAAFRELDVALEPSAFEEVEFATEDEVTLRGRLWRGSDVALVVAHDFDNTSTGSGGQRAPQSGETLLWLSGALAREGYTVLSPDFRGHGLSDGELNKRTGATDLKAAFSWLRDQGAREVFVIGWLGAGTVAAVLDAEDDTVDFTGISLVFSPPQEVGHDADKVMPDLTTPTYFFGIDPGRTPRFAKLMSDKAGNSFGYHNFEAVPTGLTFVDVFGGELAGRILDFVETVTA